VKRRKRGGSCGDKVHGELLQWAREQQELTMRWVHDQGGPSLGYQSEVERGIKQEVSSDVLASWVHILRVTSAFARGQVPRHRDNPTACAGMARAVALAIAEGRDRLPDWRAISPPERMREVLRMIVRECPGLPRVVLAHVLGLSVVTLDAMMLGTHPIMQEPAQAIRTLTTLPESFWSYGELERPDESDLVVRYLAPLRLAEQEGITPEEMTAWIRRRRKRVSS
jgi:hypothetical protein